MRRIYLTLLLSLLVATIGIPGCSASTECPDSITDNDVLFQTSMLSTLSEGDYDGDLTYEELEKHGDFGLGTFDSLDGEMIALESEFYQIKVDGIAHPVDGSMETPFAVVTFFEPDKTVSLDEVSDYEQLKQQLDGILSNRDIFYAIKIEGIFPYIKARSVPAQSKPYPPLDEALKGERLFEFHGFAGTLVGFWCPAYMEGINAPGYHFHFITADRMAGGHLLDCKINSAKAKIDYTSKFYLVLPEGE
ncbi:MAG: acetolactate decarboxylase [Chloroflexota bacterium]|nr:MAG: acetolactate decarboxylase [Chloroflexota bacterium]